MEIDLSNIGAVCFDCAKKLGCKPKNKVCGVWRGECGICHQTKPCTNLWHDWYIPEQYRRKEIKE